MCYLHILQFYQAQPEVLFFIHRLVHTFFIFLFFELKIFYQNYFFKLMQVASPHIFFIFIFTLYPHTIFFSLAFLYLPHNPHTVHIFF